MNIVDALSYGRSAVNEAVDELPAAQWEMAGANGRWSIKEILSHLVAYEEVMVEALKSLPGGAKTARLTEIFAQQEELGDDGFNAAAVAAHQQMSGLEVQAKLSALNHEAVALAQETPTELFRAPLPWYIPGYCFEDFVLYVNYGHKREHAAQIVAFRDRLKSSGGEGHQCER